MTGTFSPNDLNLLAGNALVQEMVRSVARMQTEHSSKLRTMPRFAQWRQVPEQTITHNGPDSLVSSMLGMVVLDFLFGLPLFSGLSQTTHAMAQFGLMANQARQEENFKPFTTKRAAHFEEILLEAEKDHYMETLNAQSDAIEQIQALQRVLELVMQMMQQQETRGGSGSGDVLNRNLSMTEFKRNRQSMSCIKTLYEREVSNVTQFRGPCLRAA